MNKALSMKVLRAFLFGEINYATSDRGIGYAY